MAFVPNDPNLEDENQDQNGQPLPTGGESAQLGAGTGAAPGGTAGAKPTPQNRTASSSGFTNLNKYIKANQPQAAQLGSQVQAKIGESINQASDAASNVDKGYAEKVNAGQYAFDAKKFDPTKQDKAQFQNLFKAPTSSFGQAGEVDAANQAIEAAKTRVDQTQSIGGRKELLGEQQSLSKAKGMNTAGLRSFDNLLLQSSAEGKSALDATRGDLENAGLTSKLEAAQARAQAVDQGAKTAQQTAAAQAKDALTKNYSGLGSSLDQKAATARQNAIKQDQALQDKVRSFQNLSSPELSRLGISQADWSQAQKLAKANPTSKLFQDGALGGGWNVGEYLSKTGDLSQLGRGNVATADDIAKARALSELSGIAGMNLDMKNLPTSSTAFNTDVSNLDISKLLASLTPEEVAAVTAQAKANSGGKPDSTVVQTKQGSGNTVGQKIAGGLSKAGKEVESWF